MTSQKCPDQLKSIKVIVWNGAGILLYFGFVVATVSFIVWAITTAGPNDVI